MAWPLEGYVYTANETVAVMKNARPGIRVSLESRLPPYIVVDHSIASVIVAGWPGELWRVQIVNPTSAAHRRK